MNKIILPTKIFGVDTKEAYERVLSRGKNQNPKTTISKTNQNVQSLDGFIYVPSIDLYVAKEKTLLNKDWDECHEELKKQNQMMLPPYQFKEFLKFLRYSKDQGHLEIFKDITKLRDPWRAEWINARFEEESNEMYMISENVIDNGKYITQKIKLDNYLAQDKTPGISLDDWLDSDAKHGLPKSNINQGELYYWAPKDGKVSRFFASSVRAYLSCSGDRSYANSGLGVRACREATGAKI